MGELEEKLENILGNPQAMAQIMSLAQSLSGQGAGAPEQVQPQEQSQTQAQPQVQTQEQPQTQVQERASTPAAAAQSEQAASPAASLPDLSGMLGALGNLDTGALSAAAKLMGQFTGGGDDKRTALLTALRPFVKEERYAKLDKAIQIAKLSRLIRSGLDLFRAGKEGDGHV